MKSLKTSNVESLLKFIYDIIFALSQKKIFFNPNMSHIIQDFLKKKLDIDDSYYEGNKTYVQLNKMNEPSFEPQIEPISLVKQESDRSSEGNDGGWDDYNANTEGGW